jgi:imidazolonepropionase-like amidohydrolase
VVNNGAYIVPTLAVVSALHEDGERVGFPPASRAKLEAVYAKLLSGLEIMRNEGVRMGFGTDLMGPHQDRQCTEFELRREVLSPLEILRSATSVNAEIMQLDGKVGSLSPGAFADLIVVDGDPVEDLSLLSQDGARLSLIMKGGVIEKQVI